jgi:hypothetical protein
MGERHVLEVDRGQRPFRNGMSTGPASEQPYRVAGGGRVRKLEGKVGRAQKLGVAGEQATPNCEDSGCGGGFSSEPHMR